MKGGPFGPRADHDCISRHCAGSGSVRQTTDSFGPGGAVAWLSAGIAFYGTEANRCQERVARGSGIRERRGICGDFSRQTYRTGTRAPAARVSSFRMDKMNRPNYLNPNLSAGF